MYQVKIEETSDRDGTFIASVWGFPIQAISRDPEHDICRELVKKEYPDGPVQFWRNEIKSLFHPSVHRLSKVRIEMGRTFPYHRVPKKDGAPVLDNLL